MPAESFTHLDIKSDLYWSQVQQDSYAEVEKTVGSTRIDVLTQVDEHTLAIEIQHTRIQLKTALRRMKQHTLAGYYTLWIFTPELLMYQDDSEAVRGYKWLLCLQMLQGGMIFLPHKDNMNLIIPARIENQMKWEKDNIVASSGRKILETKDPISLEDLNFETVYGYNVCTCRSIDWDIYGE
jgi:competence CoiA-like predicted nuclease